MSRLKRKLARYSLASLALTATLGTGLTGLATQGRGCAGAPGHGGAVLFPGTSTTAPVRFIGEANDSAIRVMVRAAKLVPNASGVATVSSIKSLLPDPTLTTTPEGKKVFDVTYNVPRAHLIGGQSVNFWPQDDVTGFFVSEVLPDGTTRQMETAAVGGGLTSHRLMGVADQPDANNFGLLTNPFHQIPGQVESTFLSIRGTPTASDDYYIRIGAPGTLDAWKASLGFPANEFVAYYRNENDLGFGREMHCRVGGTNAFGVATRAACYVTNYNDEDDAVTGIGKIATVAMDFDVSRSENKVRFIVYNNVGNIINRAELDAGRNKAVPNLCLNCHGGLVSNNVVTGAHFLPFDKAFLPVPAAKGEQAQEFKALNAIVWSVERNNGVNAITELAEGWYLKPDQTTGLFDSTTPYNGQFAPPGWSSDPAPYLTMVAPYCRGCHSAQRSSIDWNTKQEFVAAKFAIEARVCRKQGVMPHAQRTYQKFWESGARAVVAVDLGFGKCAFTPGFP